MTSGNKFIVQIGLSDEKITHEITELIKEHYPLAIVYRASKSVETLQKMRTVPPTLLITSLEFAKMTARDLITDVLRDRTLVDVTILLVCNVPEKELHVDDVVNGRIHFISGPFKRETFMAGFNLCTQKTNANTPKFSLKSIKKGEILFREHDEAESAYLVKSGKLRAFNQKPSGDVLLGEILTGEFVGEMAILNGEKRSATVEALEDCELISIPPGSLDVLVFSKPAWSKALVRTLAKRLKSAIVRE